MDLITDFFSFLQAAPTSWHAVSEIKKRLLMKQFSLLEENKAWSLEKGGKYAVSRGGSVAAFCLPSSPPKQILLLAGHTDSPALKVKPNPILIQNGMHLLEVEVYGGPILHSWLNRDLALAGRFFQNKEGHLQEKLVFLKDRPILIPELAIHLHREVNEKGPLLNKQEHLMPILCSDKNPLNLSSLLGTDSFLGFDLFLVPIEEPKIVGLNQDLIASYRLDNLASVHSALTALLTYQDSPLLPITLFFDHEEVGSKSWEGAASSFLQDLLARIKHFYNLTEEEFLILKQNSLCLSLDMAHAVNPLHSQKHDPNHKPLLGEGIVLKHNADLKYTSSAYTISKAMQIAEKAKVRVQQFVSRSDMPCGSTIGPILTSSIGIPSVDLGCAELSMHSAREIMAVKDHIDCTAFLVQALNPL